MSSKTSDTDDSVSISSSSSSDGSKEEMLYRQKDHTAHYEKRSQMREFAKHVHGSFNRTKPLLDPQANLEFGSSSASSDDSDEEEKIGRGKLELDREHEDRILRDRFGRSVSAKEKGGKEKRSNGTSSGLKVLTKKPEQTLDEKKAS